MDFEDRLDSLLSLERLAREYEVRAEKATNKFEAQQYRRIGKDFFKRAQDEKESLLDYARELSDV